MSAPTRVIRGRAFVETALVFSAALVIGLLALRPFFTMFADHLVPNLFDPLLCLFLMAWGGHQLRLGMPAFWDAPFFYPTPHVTALSDHLLGPSLFGVAANALGLSTTAAYNLIVLLSFPLAAVGAYWLIRRCGLRPVAAFLGALAFAFAPFRWMHLEHMQVLWIPALPFVLLLGWRFLEAPSWRRGIAFYLVYVVHLSGGTYFAYMIHVPLLMFVVLERQRLIRHLTDRRTLLPMAAVATACLATLLALFLPYLGQSAKGYRRGGEVIQMWGATLVSFVTPSLSNRYFPETLHGWYRNENALFPGLLAAGALVALLVHHYRRAVPRPWPPWRRALLAVGTIAVGAALYLGELVTWRDRESIMVGSIPVRIRGYTRPLLLLAVGAALCALAWHRQRGAVRRESPRRRLRRAVTAQAIVSAVLCLPIVFSQAARVVPGMSGLGVSSRFFMFALLGSSLSVAIAASLAARRLHRRWRHAVVLACGMALLGPELVPARFGWSPIDQPESFPAAYQYMQAAQLHGPVVEFPIPRPERVRDELRRVWRTQLTWNPVANGYSGYYPRPYVALRNAYLAGDLAATSTLARSFGMRFAIVHLDEIPDNRRLTDERYWRERIAAHDAELRWEDPQTLVIELTDHSLPRPAHAAFE